MALSGRHLRVGCELWLPWSNTTSEPDGIVKTSGVSVDMLNIIAKKLNFTYSFYRPSDREWGRELPNGSFTGMIGMCQKNEVDVALGPFVMAWDRYQAADYSTPIHYDEYGLILPRPRREVDLSGVAKPLSWQVWMSLGLSIWVCLIIGLVMNQIRKRFVGGNRLLEKEKIQMSWIIRVVLAETVDRLPSGPTARIYIITWMLVGLIMQAAYSGVLISLLVVPKVPVPVDSVEDLASYGKIPLLVIIGNYVHNIFSKAKEGVYKEVLDKAIVRRNFAEESLLWATLKREKVALFTPVIGILKHMSDDYTLTGQCNFYLAKEGILPAHYALAFPKKSDLIPHFNKWLDAQKESGIISHSIFRFTTNVTACMARPGKEGGSDLTALTFMDLSGVFFAFGIGTGFSFIIFIIEIVLKRI
ncbi:glutamate receptor ionotropic, kainate glr-3-like [Palaemon carinicauda]|uniref:glutamate receptor ionotropic, kainate glr-3-like n=1 Tax=Palaemon carinicauda TaxID=392227 RepID=UPI0035B663FF